MLTDRPDVPHTLLGRLKPPKMGVWGHTQERAYNLNDNVSRGFIVRSFIILFCDLRSPTTVRGQSKVISGYLCLKNAIRWSHIVHYHVIRFGWLVWLLVW